MPRIVYLSVHDIVDLLLRTGHIDNRVFNRSSMEEGTRLHSFYQGQQNGEYISEYALFYSFERDDFIFKVSGKADGLFVDNDGNYTIEEIKTTVDDLDHFIKDHGQWHLGQAMFYAFMLAKDKGLDNVNVKMTYIRQNNFRVQRHFTESYTLRDLTDFTDDLIFRYLNYCKKIQRRKDERNESAKDLVFPFKEFRSGQKEICDFVKESAIDRKNVFIEAPTGIGKTVSVLYPLLSLFGEKKADRIYYLTSKNSIKKIAVNGMNLFKSEGLKCDTIEFTSKENICFNDKVGHCNPDECPFARNYFDHLIDNIFDCMEENEMFDRNSIEDFCYRHKICPFQFQLDLSNNCDVIICDYSYVYDYRDHLCLKESNIRSTDSYLLVDECHNLPDRVRDMYSTELYLSEIKKAQGLCQSEVFDQFKKDLSKAVKEFKKIEIPEENPYEKDALFILEKMPEPFKKKADSLIEDMREILKKHTSLTSDEFMQFFYELNSFSYLYDLVSEMNDKRSFLIYCRYRDDEVTSIRISNLDSRPLIIEDSSLFRSAIFFSATLTPKDYYIDLLGGDKEDMNNRLVLPSPFPIENRRVLFDTNLSLRYKDRDETLYPVFALLKAAISAKKGNYFVFCPSFDYMERIESYFNQEQLEDIDILVQKKSMSEKEREEFLTSFSYDNPRITVGLLVLGGIFSEGIDLVGDRLIGAIIISVGIPQIGFERNALRNYYTEEDMDEHKGYHYAYTYPGINKVLQAAGRVIRTENDKGFILYIDSRYRQKPYYDIFNEIYPDAKRVISPSQLKNLLKNLWKEDE